MKIGKEHLTILDCQFLITDYSVYALLGVSYILSVKMIFPRETYLTLTNKILITYLIY